MESPFGLVGMGLETGNLARLSTNQRVFHQQKKVFPVPIKVTKRPCKYARAFLVILSCRHARSCGQYSHPL